MECLKCSQPFETKYEIMPHYKDWCGNCIEKYNIKSREPLWEEWIKAKSDSEIDRLIEKYAIYNNRIPEKDGGFYKCPENNDETYMNRYGFYNYDRLIEQWNVSGNYVCSYRLLQFILPCFSCGSICTPETRKLINTKKMYFKCICGLKYSRKQNGIMQCECSNVADNYSSTKHKIQFEILKKERNNEPVDESLLKKLEEFNKKNQENKFICDSVIYGDCSVVCSSHDSIDLVVRPEKTESAIFCRGVTKEDIEESSPNLLKYYDKDDYFMSYIFACLNCKKCQTFRGDHVAFEIGDVFECQHCNNPFTYIKISDKDPIKLPEKFQFIVDKINKKK